MTRWTAACVLLAAIALPVRAQDAPVLRLGAEEPKNDDQDDASGGLLLRELFRQAVLIAARDELGVATRDASLHEELGEGPRLDVTMTADPHESVVFRLRRGSKQLLRRDIPIKGGGHYDRVIARLEALSRGDLVGALGSAGYAGAKLPPRATAKEPLPEAVSARLERFTIGDQLALVQAVHELRAKKGESPERLAALVRGYAHLGVLCERQWSVAHKVFKARALLYAERLVALDPASSFALGHRAYARALAGLHADVDAGLDGKTDLPTFTPLVLAYARGRRPLIQSDPAAAQHPALARLLALLTVEDSRGEELQVRLGTAILAAEPGCERVRDLLAVIAPVGSRDGLTAEGLERAQKALEAARRDAAAAGAADRSVPGLAAAARLHEDSALLAAFRRAEHLRSQKPDDLPDLIRSVKATFEEHPYAVFVTSLAKASEKRKRLLEDLSITEASFDHAPLIAATWGIESQAVIGAAARDAARFHVDPIERDLRQHALQTELVWADAETSRDVIERYRAACPQSPLALAIALRRDVEKRSGARAGTLAEESEHPDLLEALARRADAKRDLETAAAWWEKRAEASADASALYQVAEHLERAKRWTDWRKAVDRMCAADPGADHGGAMRLRLAKRLIAKGRAAEALPYVESAATAKERSTLEFAAECFEEAGDFERAERCVRTLSETYTPFVADWFYWCKRTGKGDAEAARKFAEKDVERWAKSTTAGAQKEAAAFFLVAGERARALEAARQAFDESHQPFWGLQLAILSKSKKRRAEALEEVIDNKALAGEREKRLIPLAKALQGCLEDADKLDDKTIAGLRESESEQDALLIDYVAGSFLEARGKPDRARPCYERVLAKKCKFDVPLGALAREGLGRIDSAKKE